MRAKRLSPGTQPFRVASLIDTESTFWEEIALNELEDLRLRLHGLVPFLDKKKRNIVYTDFQDQIIGVWKEEVVVMPKMTGIQYEKKIKEYLANHLDHIL